MRALIHYQLGICYAMLFHEDEAVENMNLVFNYVRRVCYIFKGNPYIV